MQKSNYNKEQGMSSTTKWIIGIVVGIVLLITLIMSSIKSQYQKDKYQPKNDNYQGYRNSSVTSKKTLKNGRYTAEFINRYKDSNYSVSPQFSCDFNDPGSPPNLRLVSPNLNEPYDRCEWRFETINGGSDIIRYHDKINIWAYLMLRPYNGTQPYYDYYITFQEIEDIPGPIAIWANTCDIHPQEYYPCSVNPPLEIQIVKKNDDLSKEEVDFEKEFYLRIKVNEQYYYASTTNGSDLVWKTTWLNDNARSFKFPKIEEVN